MRAPNTTLLPRKYENTWSALLVADELLQNVKVLFLPIQVLSVLYCKVYGIIL